MSSRVNLGKAEPDLYRLVSSLDTSASNAMAVAGFDHGFIHLIALRTSQINQCAFCMRLHTRDALSAGVSADRIAVLPAWREAGYFTDKEQAALDVTEAITRITEGQFADAVYERIAVHLSSREIAAVSWHVIVANTWNRIAIASRYDVKP